MGKVAVSGGKDGFSLHRWEEKFCGVVWERYGGMAGLKARGKLPVSGDHLLKSALLVCPLPCLRALVEHLQLGLFVLQHPGLGTDARLQVKGGLLIRGAADGADQLLDRREPAA